MAQGTDNLPDAQPWNLPPGWMLPPCPFDLNGAHDFDAHVVDGLVVSQSCRKCGLILPFELDPDTGEPENRAIVDSAKATAATCPHCQGRFFVWGFGDPFISKTNPARDS